MKAIKQSPMVLKTRQLNLLFEPKSLTGLSPLERGKVKVVLAQILMQAAGLNVEDLSDDKH